MLVWSGGTISGCVLRRVQQVRNVWSSWWWWWKETGSEQQSPLSRSQDLLILVSEQLKFSVLVSSREFLNKRESCIQEEVCVKCQSANWEQRWWQSAAVTRAGRVFLSFSFCGFKVFILSVTQCYLHRDRRGWEVSRLLSSSWQADPYCSLLSSETEGRSRGGSTGIQAEDDSGNVLYIIIRHWGLNLYLSLSSTNSHTVTQSYQPLDLWDRVIMGTCKSILPGVRICACGWTNNSSTNQRRMRNGLLENNGGFSRCRRRCCSNSSVRAGE